VVEPDLRKQSIKSRPFFLPHPLKTVKTSRSSSKPVQNITACESKTEHPYSSMVDTETTVDDYFWWYVSIEIRRLK
jgi:hypothetical protein